jgi:hypothetical protein
MSLETIARKQPAATITAMVEMIISICLIPFAKATSSSHGKEFVSGTAIGCSYSYQNVTRQGLHPDTSGVVVSALSLSC